ncbi:MAG: DegV family protein [Chloroflexi bacterium]|nr:DegV family protein [Chloroflexota bacterium]
MRLKAKTAIVSDSALSLPRDVAGEYGLYIVPMKLTFQGRTYLDGYDLEPSEFYRLLRTSDSLPVTSAPDPGSFLEVFSRASDNAEGILCLTVASRLSASYQSAKVALEMAKESLPNTPITLLDSGSAAGGQALIALESAGAALRGHDLEHVTQAAQRVIQKVRVIAFLDTLFYLWKGGRVPKVALWATSIIKMKPIMELFQGEVHLIERPRTRSHAVGRLIDIMHKHVGKADLHVAVMHADDIVGAEELKENIASDFHYKELIISEFTPVMGAHTGPGLLGLAFWSE